MAPWAMPGSKETPAVKSERVVRIDALILITHLLLLR
jgi:ABC-type hemin transport system substrate-binding protein